MFDIRNAEVSMLTTSHILFIRVFYLITEQYGTFNKERKVRNQIKKKELWNYQNFIDQGVVMFIS